MRKNSSLLLAIAISASLASCTGSKPNDKVESSDSTAVNEQEAASVSEGIDTAFKVSLSNSEDSVAFENKDYRVIIVPHDGEVGDRIGVYDKSSQKSFSIDEGESYFVSVVNDYMIIDNGTSNMRGLSIYDLKSVRRVFESSYVDDLAVKNETVRFKTPIEIADSTRRPKCPEELKDVQDGIGYVEVQIFDLKTLQLNKTGDCECFYFE